MEHHTAEYDMKTLYREYGIPVSILLAGIIIAGAMLETRVDIPATELAVRSAIEEAVLPTEGVKLPIAWKDLGARLVEAGAIDPVAFKKVYEARGPFPADYEKLLSGKSNGRLTITEDNAGYLLNLLWAFGLANANPILDDKTEMMNPAYGGAGSFASTGGWTIAKGNAMEHYSKHVLVELTQAQQELVDRMSQNIYRPCCGNATHFPDCNHGVAMLGLLELMASQGVSEEDMYKAALAVNSYWFPGTYLTMAEYMHNNDVNWEAVSPKEMLGADYSSAAGYARIVSLVSEPSGSGANGGCGVESGSNTSRQQSGCGI